VRIGYLCADFGVPVFGSKGASIHIRELARALHALGHEVLILTPRADGSVPTGFDVRVLEITTDDAARPAPPELLALRYAAVLRRDGLAALHAFRPDVVYERYSLCGTAGMSLAAELGIPFLVEVNAPLSDEQAEHRGLTLAETAHSLEREVLRAADHVVAVSSSLERWLIELGVDRQSITVVPNGVDPSRFAATAADGDAVRARLGLVARPVVGFLGTLKPWHDVATLVRAVACLRQQGLEAALLLIGDGPERSSMEELARSEGIEVTCTGAMPYESVPAHLAAMDVAAAPYAQSDSFYFSPLKLVEYLAAARPVVAAETGDLGHCVRPGVTGSLYPPGDVGALAEAIGGLLSDADRAASLGRAGREHVCEQHTWEGNARTVVALAQTELERRRVA
jgi:glycosyltransferase involved in cell wall biosynthesis